MGIFKPKVGELLQVIFPSWDSLNLKWGMEIFKPIMVSYFPIMGIFKTHNDELLHVISHHGNLQTHYWELLQVISHHGNLQTHNGELLTSYFPSWKSSNP